MYGQSKMLPTSIKINGKQILPKKKLNMEYHGGSLTPIIGPVTKTMCGNGIRGGDLYTVHTDNRYKPLSANPIISSYGQGVGEGNYGQGMYGGWLQFLPLIPTAIDLLGKLFKGNGLHDYIPHIQETPREVEVEFIDKTTGRPIHKTNTMLNGLGIRLLHEPELVHDLIYKTGGMGDDGTYHLSEYDLYRQGYTPDSNRYPTYDLPDPIANETTGAYQRGGRVRAATNWVPLSKTRDPRYINDGVGGAVGNYANVNRI